MFFTSDRNERIELFTYLTETGEIICISPQNDTKYWYATVDFTSTNVYLHDNTAIYGWNIKIKYDSDSSNAESVIVKEWKICSAPQGFKFTSSLTQSADLNYLSATLTNTEDPNKKEIVSVSIDYGEIQTLMSFDTDTAITHVQFNKYNPHLLRYSRDEPRNIGIHRMWVVDIRNPGISKKIYMQGAEESVTHEDWWINDQLTFCAGYKTNEYHVKVISIHDEKARIIGAGAWWEGASPSELARYNWWHASGSRDGKWVAADNWHGDIGIFDSRTSQLYMLTKNHRIYGGGHHPHVGWAPDSKSVEFTSNLRGNPDVCIAYLPSEKWGNRFLK
jgi:hypothetical protein